MADVFTLIGKLVDIGKALRDVGELVRDAQTKNLIADLNLALADLKSQAAELQEQNLALRKRISELEAQEDFRSKLELRDGAYWFLEPVANYPAGPYCTGCFDSSGKLIVLNAMPPEFHDFGHYRCPICTQSYGGKRF